MKRDEYKEAREFKSVQLKPLLGQLRTNLEKMKETKLVKYTLRIFEEIELRLD